MKVINKDVRLYFEHYSDSTKILGFDTASRRYYLEKIDLTNREPVYAVTTQKATAYRVGDTIKVVEYDSLEDARKAFNKLKSTSKSFTIEFATA